MLIDKELIQKAKSKLGDDMATMIAEELDIIDFDTKNLKCCCPFHHEKTPSFIWNKKALRFHCFGKCGRNYDILDVYMHKGMTYMQAVEKLFDKADIPYAFGERGVQTEREYKYPKPVECTDKSKVYEYLATRKISPETIDYLDIRQDEHGNIVFNYYDHNDVLTMVKYRPSRKINPGDNKNWCQPGSGTSPLLFNMNRVNVSEPLLITSGELDCAAAVEAGWKNAVSIPLGDQNLHWIEKNYEWLEQFDTIIICPDNDDSGTKYCKEVIPRLGSWRCKVAEVPARLDGMVHHLKDINELLYFGGRDAVLQMILNAKDSPVPSVKNLSDVHDIDYDEIDGIYTGIKPLDKELFRLFYGTLTIVSGAPGAGKSSFLSQLMCSTLEQGKNAWMFSGELPEYMVKNWLNFILAGRKHIQCFDSENGDPYYKVMNDSKTVIDDYYNGRWYVYRDDWDNNIATLMESMTDVVRKYGCSLLILDNMMTIDTSNSEEELRSQTDLIKQLIQFARRFNVVVVLVAHPRKLLGTNAIGMYDIAGSANIANLAHRTIGIRRMTDAEREQLLGNSRVPEKQKDLAKYDVVVSIIKDRMRGRSNTDIGLYYDEPTRRFYSNPDEFYYRYGWDNEPEDRSIPYPPDHRDADIFGEYDEDDEE